MADDLFAPPTEEELKNAGDVFAPPSQEEKYKAANPGIAMAVANAKHQADALTGGALAGAKYLGVKALQGSTYLGEKVDPYLGAPVRAAIGQAQDTLSDYVNGDKPANASDIVKAYINQIGQDRSKAPTGKQLAQKAGMPDTSASDILPGFYSESGKGFALKKGGAFDPTASGIAGWGLDVASDPMTYIPFGRVAKGVGKLSEFARPAIESAGNVMGKAGGLVGESIKNLSTKFSPEVVGGAIGHGLGEAAEAIGAPPITKKVFSAMGTVAGTATRKYGPAVLEGAKDLAGAITKTIKGEGAEKFLNLIQSAQNKGPAAVATMHYLLQQSEPEYAAAITGRH